MPALAQLWRDNPVLVKELRVRMRGSRAYWILTGYLLFLSLILFFQYVSWWNQVQSAGHGTAEASKIGQEFFATIALVQAFLVAFITPAVTSGAITVEREQRTLEMLEITRLSPGTVVTGKLLSAVSFVALLLVSSLPLTSVCFFLGGVSPEQVIEVYLMLLAGSILAGGLGLVWSAVSRTTAIAVAATYASLVVPVVVAGIGLGATSAVMGANGGMIATLALSLFGPVTSLPVDTSVEPFFAAWDQRHYFALTVPQWFVPVATLTLVGLILGVAATVRLSPAPKRRSWLLRLLVAGLFAEQAFFLFGARLFVYSRTAPPGLAAILQPYPLLALLFYPVLLLLLVTPVFSTGDVSPQEARRFGAFLMRGWTIHGWREGRLNAGLPYLAALVAVVFGVYWLSFAIVGQPGAALTGQMHVAGAPAPTPPSMVNGNPTIQLLVPGSAPAGAGGVLQILVATLAAVAGLSALGLVYSVAIRNRWAALALSYGTVFAILVVPILARATYFASADRGSPGFLVNLFYLDPLVAIIQTTSVGGFSNGMALYGDNPVWLVGSVLWAFVALLAAAFAVPLVARHAARRV